MRILQDLAIPIGTAISKMILRFWLGSPGLLSGLGSDLVDVLKQRTTDLLASRNAARQFEAIADQVADNLASVIQAESPGFSEESYAAIASAALALLADVPLSAAILARHNLDPQELNAYLVEHSAGRLRDLSGVEQALFERILSESCRLIVDIASRLPSFSERTFSEILRREDHLLTAARQILEEVRRVRESSRDQLHSAGRFETEYRLSVARRLDRMELLGLDISLASARYRLTVAYVTLTVTRQRRRALDPAERTDDSSDDPSRRGPALFSTSTRPAHRALQRLQSRRLFLRGMAGSGKTTFLQWIAVRSALQDFPQDLADWNRTIPFFIRIRQFADARLPLPDDFARAVAPLVYHLMPEGWVHEQLRSGRAIVIVDGLDEISETRRRDLYEWCDDLIESYPTARFIVSSRPHAVSAEWLRRHDFEDAELQPMDFNAISALVDRWHQAIREQLHEAEEREELPALATNLKRLLRARRPIRALAANPLLCAMLCALHRDRRRQLPSDRVELYEAACYMLLERRDVERRVELRDYPSLTYRQKRTLLQALGYWMLRNSWSELAAERVQEYLTHRVASMEGVARETTARDIYRLLVDRSGLVREPAAGRFDFVHKTFQEYLAAHAVLDQDDVGVLVANAHDDHWREVVVLATGIATLKTRREILQGLLDRGDTSADLRHRLHLLALGCMEAAVEIPPELRTQLEKCAAALVPLESRTDVNALASAGELAAPYLSRAKQQTVELGDACIEALARIGGLDALEAIASWTVDPTDRICAALLQAWDAFERREYAEVVVAKLLSQPGRSVLRLKRVPSFDGFEHLAATTEVDVKDLQAVGDLAAVATLTNLRHLRLRGIRSVTSLAPLGRVAGLETVELAGGHEIEDISFVIDLKHLRVLALRGFANLADVASIAALDGLVELDLTGCLRLSDVSPLAECKSLASVSMVACPSVRDISPLARLPNLHRLDLTACQHIAGLEALRTSESPLMQRARAYGRTKDGGGGRVWTRAAAEGSGLLLPIHLAYGARLRELFE